MCAIAATFELSDEQTNRTVTAGYGNDAESALNNALVSAVSEVVGVMVTNDIRIKNEELIEENITTHSKGFVQSYKVVSTEVKDRTYIITIDAIVRTEKLKSTFKQLNISTIEIADPEALYAQKYTQVRSVESVKSFIKTELPKLYQNQKDLFNIEILSFDYDENNADKGGIEFILTFAVSVDASKCARMADDVVRALINYEIIDALSVNTSQNRYYTVVKKNIGRDTIVYPVSSSYREALFDTLNRTIENNEDKIFTRTLSVRLLSSDNDALYSHSMVIERGLVAYEDRERLKDDGRYGLLASYCPSHWTGNDILTFEIDENNPKINASYKGKVRISDISKVKRILVEVTK
jgi:hypothetical protein